MGNSTQDGKSSKREREETVISEVLNGRGRLQDQSCVPTPAREMDNLGNCHLQGKHMADIWRLPQARLGFLIRATYDTHPVPRAYTSVQFG